MKVSAFAIAATLMVSACASTPVAVPVPAKPAAPQPAPEPPAAPVPPPTPGAFTAAEAAGDPANWRAVDPARMFVFDTTKGRILIETFPEVAPKHVAQFTQMIKDGALDGTTFHRVISDFMAQGGDIEAKLGTTSPYPNIPAEFTFRRDPKAIALEAPIGAADAAPYGYTRGFPIATQASFFAEMSKDGRVESWIPHCRGVVSTARTDDPNSGNSQFFLMREHTPHLDKQYTAWGRVIVGEEVVRAIKAGAPRTGTVTNPDKLISAKVASDIPGKSRPKAWVMRTDAPAFQQSLAAQGTMDVCELTSVPAVADR